MKYELQRSFSSGELSPKTHMRNDLGNIYDSGLSVLENMLPNSRGTAETRESLAFFLSFLAEPDARLEVFQSGDSFVLLIFLHLRLIIIRDVLAPAIESQSAPWTSDQLEALILVPIPKSKTVYVFHPEVQTQKLTNNINPTSSYRFTQTGVFTAPAGITSMTYCLTSAGGGGSSGASGIRGGGGGGGGAINGLVSVSPGETISCTIGSGGDGGDSNIASGNGLNGGDSILSVISTVITSIGGFGSDSGSGGGSATGGLGGSGGGNGGDAGLGGGQALDCVGQVIPGGNPGAGATGGGGGAGGESNGANGGDDKENGINAALNSGGGGGGSGGARNNLLGGDGGSGNCLLTWTLPADGFRIDPVFFVNAPNTWGLSNWPSAGAYFGGRLWAGGAPEDPEEFVGSKINELEDFSLGLGTPSDAIKESIQDIGHIKWMKGTKVLLVGTTTGEYAMRSEGKSLIPSDIFPDLQSSYGSAAIDPVKIGDQIMYVTPDRRRINAMNYEFLKENWLSIDLTYFSEHITSGEIKQVAWSQHPDKVLWVLLRDGTLSSLSYERTNNTFGWARHPTSGFIRSITVGFQTDRSTLVAAVERINGDLVLEYMSRSHKVDSWMSFITANSYGDFVFIDGLDHLEGLPVHVLVDEINHNRIVIVGAESESGAADGVPGRVYLDLVGTLYVIGLQYIPLMTSIGSSREERDGNDFMHEKTYSEIAVQILDSRRPLVNGMDTYERDTLVPQGTPMPSETRLLVVGNTGWDIDAFITISQPLPYKLTVSAIGGKYKANKI